MSDRYLLPLMLCLLLSIKTGLVNAEDSRLQAAQDCTQISARFERLACFDQVFNTPTQAEIEQGKSLTHSPAWQRAMASEQQRDSHQGFAIFYHDPAQIEQGVWITATANNADHAAPILMLSCFDNITRLELVLPEPLNIGKANITIAGRQLDTQRWLSDASGTILRPGRGIPAIAAINALMSLDQPVIRADLAEVNGLSFDASGLRQLISPLRQACHW